MVMYVEEGKFSLTSDCVLLAKLSKSDYQKTSENSSTLGPSHTTSAADYHQ